MVGSRRAGRPARRPMAETMSGDPLVLHPKSAAVRAALIEIARLASEGATCDITVELAQGGVRRFHVGNTFSGDQLEQLVRGRGPLALAGKRDPAA